MTMPHLMNCSHSSDGWCLDCVKAMHDELEPYKEKYENLLTDVARAADVDSLADCQRKLCEIIRNIALDAKMTIDAVNNAATWSEVASLISKKI